MALFGISMIFLNTYFLIKIKDANAWFELSNKMDTCYLLVDVQEIRIQPHFCIKQGDYFFHFFLDTLYVSYSIVTRWCFFGQLLQEETECIIPNCWEKLLLASCDIISTRFIFQEASHKLKFNINYSIIYIWLQALCS